MTNIFRNRSKRNQAYQSSNEAEICDIPNSNLSSADDNHSKSSMPITDTLRRTINLIIFTTNICIFCTLLYFGRNAFSSNNGF